MAHKSTTREPSYPEEKALYMAFELSKEKWLVRCSSGGKKFHQQQIRPGDEKRLEELLMRARSKLELAEDVRVFSVCEAGRDGFWPHRFLEKQGIENIVIDPASMDVKRHQRNAKNDGIDVRRLLSDLVRYHRYGDDDVWRVVRVPSEKDEDDRYLHRELERLKKERTQVRNGIRSMLATQGIQVVGSLRIFLNRPDQQSNWKGEPLQKRFKYVLEQKRERLELIEAQIAENKRIQREEAKSPTDEKLKKVEKMQTLKGIGLDSAWLITMELFGWRKFANRREVGGSVGLGGTPYDSGQMTREQGISKTGNKRVRARLIELSWLWLRYQPNSNLTKWFNARYSETGKRSKRIGIVAVARRLLIQLWHFVEHNVDPPGEIIVRP